VGDYPSMQAPLRARAGARMHAGQAIGVPGGRGPTILIQRHLDMALQDNEVSQFMRCAFSLRPIEDLFYALPFVKPSGDLDIVGGLTVKT